MQEPIKVGDLCLVISGAFDTDGPNIGKQVTVKSLRGEHSLYGRIWSCQGDDLITEFGAVGNIADFAASWLKKIIPPEKQDTVIKKVELQE